MNNSTKKLLFYVVIPATIIGSCAVLLFIELPAKLYVVSSESMLPALKTGDALVISNSEDTCSSFDCLKAGDIIVFKSIRTSNLESKTIVHRIEEVDSDSSGKKILITKGDANPQPIQGIDYPVTEDLYVGKVIHILPYAGLVLMYLDILAQVFVNPMLYLLIGTMAATILLLEYKKKHSSFTRRKIREPNTKL
jgi:signal peptidase I